MVSKISVRIDSRHRPNGLSQSERIGIWELDLETDSIFFSSDWSELRGCESKDSLRTLEQATQFIHPDDRVKREELLFRLRAGECEEIECEHRVKKNDGCWTTVVEKSHLIRNKQGQPIRLVGCESEISAVGVKTVGVKYPLADEEFKKPSELRTLNERLCKVLDSSFIGIWEWFFEDERLVWDERMHEIYGVNRAGFHGTYDDWSVRVHPADLERVLTHDQCREQLTRQPAQEFRIVRPNGEVRHVYSNAHIEFDEFGTPARSIGVNIDITDRREAEFALLESEGKLKRIADHLPGMVFRYFLDSEGNQGWNYLSPKVQELFGLDPSDLMADTELLWQMIDPDDLEQLREGMLESAKELSLFVKEFRITTNDRGTRWFQLNSQPQNVENGTVVWDGVVLEITDKKNAEINLQDAKEQLERITENVPGMIFRQSWPKNGNHIATFVSSRSLEMFGVEPAAALADAAKLLKWIHSEDLNQLWEAIRLSVDSLAPLSMEYRVTPPHENTRWYQVTGQAGKLENGDVTLDGVVLDITDRKEAELANDVLAKATKTKDQFLANMSHELRTPLTAILGMTDGLQQGMFGEATPKQLECLKIVEQSSVHLLDLINEILDLAKIESGQSELDFSAIEVSKLCESCLNLVAPQAKQNLIELSLKASWDLPRLKADEKRIRQVLINLLGNAVKFTPQGGKVELAVEALPAVNPESAQDTLRFSVSDSGIGIEADQLEAMFDPFVQVDSSLTREHGGTGLGLSLVKQLVELHDGKVGVTSEPGRGSCFTVELPLGKEYSQHDDRADVLAPISLGEKADSDLQIDSAIPNESGRELQPLILLAEDNDMVAQSIIPMLEFSGFQVLRAANGKIAVEMTLEHLPNLILMDIQMPVMDGFEATRQIRSNTGFSDLPIIAVSGLAKAEDSQRCIDAGMNLFIAKPLRIKELVGSIKSMLNSQREN